MDLKEIINEAILTYAIGLTSDKFQKLPPDKKVEQIIKINPKLRALAENSTSEPDKALGLFGVTRSALQLCPKCNGQGTVSKPPWVAGDVYEWSSTSTSFTCDLCNGAKVI